MAPAALMFDRADEDIQRAIDEVDEGVYPIDEYDSLFVKGMLVDDAITMAGSSYAPFIQPGSLKDLDDEQTDSALTQKGKSEDWSDLAKGWLEAGIPAIVFVDISSEEEAHYLLGDGHHRLAYANAKGLETIDVIIMRRRRTD